VLTRTSLQVWPLLDAMLCVKSTTEVGKHPGQALAPLYSVHGSTALWTSESVASVSSSVSEEKLNSLTFFDGNVTYRHERLLLIERLKKLIV